ncbi:MAG: thioredoxin domain-containing protein, partial [Anaerolineaceae bacterium]|nr:thioredoxin domain-containing protein [Anaerolineaceae bacterium]
EQAGKLVIAKVNTDEHQEWAMKYGVQGIPTMLFIANGEVVRRQVGALPEPVLRDVTNQFLEAISADNRPEPDPRPLTHSHDTFPEIIK